VKPRKAFAKALREALETVGLTCEQLAEALDVPLGQAEAWEKGVIPDPHMLFRISKALRCTFSISVVGWTWHPKASCACPTQIHTDCPKGSPCDCPCHFWTKEELAVSNLKADEWMALFKEEGEAHART